MITLHLPLQAAWSTELGGIVVSMPEPDESEVTVAPSTLKFLQPHDITSIEQALGKIDSDGEVRLAVENGCLFSIQVLTNEPVDQSYLTELKREPLG